jgi:hypothetical protein
MANAFTAADQLSLYLTSAGGSAATGTASNSLGGCRTAIEVKQLDALISGDIANVIVEQISGACGTGETIIYGDTTTTLKVAGSDGAFGSASTVADGSTVQLVGSTANIYARVRRDGSADLGGNLSLDVRKTYNGAIGMGNVSTTDSASGKNYYRGLMLRNNGTTDLSNIYLLVGTLGTQRTTGTAQLGASGSGTIATATTNGFADWPAQGWARIKTSGGSLREIVYYTSRTSTSLTVPSTGRGRLGSSAAAGSATDTVDAVPGIRIGTEALSSEGKIQTIADENTAPSGISWYTGTTSANAASIATLKAGRHYGVWVHREIPAGATGTTSQETKLALSWSTYTQTFYGLYRVSQSSLSKWSLYAGTDTFPSFASPVTTATSLPFTYALTPPGSGSRTYRLACRYTDAYGVSSYNCATHDIAINSSGANVTTEVSWPYDVALTETAGGYVQLTAKYPTGIDSTDADKFRYYVKTDGTTATTGGSYTDAAMSFGFGLGGARILNVKLGPYSYGTPVSVLVTAYRTTGSKQSTNTTASSLTVSTVNPAPVSSPLFVYDGASNVDASGQFTTTVTYLNNPTNTVYFKTMPGVTELWSSTTLCFRIVCGTDGVPVLYFPTAWALYNSTISGTGTANAVEVVSANELYLCVAGQRVAKLDVSAKKFYTYGFDNEAAILSMDAPVLGPSFAGVSKSYIQVFDPALGRWRTGLAVDSTGLVTAPYYIQKTS